MGGLISFVHCCSSSREKYFMAALLSLLLFDWWFLLVRNAICSKRGTTLSAFYFKCRIILSVFFARRDLGRNRSFQFSQCYCFWCCRQSCCLAEQHYQKTQFWSIKASIWRFSSLLGYILKTKSSTLLWYFFSVNRRFIERFLWIFLADATSQFISKSWQLA